MASADGRTLSDNASGNADIIKCVPCTYLSAFSPSGLIKEARKLCRECNAYMCVSCADIHIGFKATRNHTVVFCAFIDLKVASSADINLPAAGRITGSTITPDGRLVLADYGQEQIILLDRNFTVQSTLTLRGKPCDVAADGDNDVIVSMGYSKQLQWIHVGGDLRAGRTVTTSLPCWGVAVHSGHIYISVRTAESPYRGHVEVLTRDGSVVRRIGVDASGAGTFTNPLYITVGASGTLYVSEFTSGGRITCFSSTGSKVYTVTHSDMRLPRGMVADDDGNLLVCCYYSNNVHVLAKDGSHSRPILTSADGLERPYSMAYRRSDGTLIVPMRYPPYCRAYKLKYGSSPFHP